MSCKGFDMLCGNELYVIAKAQSLKGKNQPRSPPFVRADTGLGSIFTGSDRVATGAAICSLTFPALSSCRANQAKAR